MKFGSRFLFRCTILLLLSLGAGSIALGQGWSYVETGTWPVDVPTDPRSVAMGESFVAVPGTPAALMYNPAGLAGFKGVEAGYAQRRLDYVQMLEGFRYHSAHLAANTPWLTFGILYNRFDLGEMVVSSAASPDGIGRGRMQQSLYALGLGRSFGDRINLGVTAKIAKNSFEEVSGAVTPSSHSAFIFDVGMMYRIPLGFSQSTDALTLGLALQNSGSKIGALEILSTESEKSNNSVRLPQYVRAGFSLSTGVRAADSEALVPFNVMVSGEYRGLVNADKEQRTRDFWGFGVEAVIYEIFSARFGGFIQPVTSIYGEARTPALRYGIGLNLPLARFGISTPLAVQAEYAAIPMSSTVFFSPNSLPRTTLQTVSITVRYTEDLF